MSNFEPFNMNRMKRIACLIFILIAASACKEVFEAPPQSMFKATLLNSTTEETIQSVVSVQGIGLDSLFYKDATLSQILLPLSPNETTSFLISFDSTVDTITLFHKTMVQYESMDKGFYNEFKLQAVDYSRNRIDSVQITDSLVTKTWHENIKLYIRPLSTGNN
jgi:hypothetical protein